VTWPCHQSSKTEPDTGRRENHCIPLPSLLLDADHQSVSRKARVDFDPESLPVSKVTRCTDDENHLFARPTILRQAGDDQSTWQLSFVQRQQQVFQEKR
jgi:hypothetical protein